MPAQGGERDVHDYIRVARHSYIEWMDGRETGMVPDRRRRKRPVFLWLYRVGSFRQLTHIYTHEIVHYVHEPEFDKNEGAVEAVTVKLMRNPVWVAVAEHQVGEALHASACKLFKKKGISIDV